MKEATERYARQFKEFRPEPEVFKDNFEFEATVPIQTTTTIIPASQGWHILRIIFKKFSPADKIGLNWLKLDKSGEKWIKLSFTIVKG